MLEPDLRQARRAGLPLAAWTLARIERARGQTDAALGLARAFLAESDSDDSFRRPAERLMAELGASAEGEAGTRHDSIERMAWSAFFVGPSYFLLLGRARFRGRSLARAVRRKPDFFPEASTRHR